MTEQPQYFLGGPRARTCALRDTAAATRLEPRMRRGATQLALDERLDLGRCRWVSSVDHTQMIGQASIEPIG